MANPLKLQLGRQKELKEITPGVTKFHINTRPPGEEIFFQVGTELHPCANSFMVVDCGTELKLESGTIKTPWVEIMPLAEDGIPDGDLATPNGAPATLMCLISDSEVSARFPNIRADAIEVSS